MNDNFERINQLLLRSDKILLIGHRRPDEDAMGAVLSFYIYLKSLGKQADIFINDRPPEYLSFLPEIAKASTDRSLLEGCHDLYFFLDCGSIGNTGLSEEIIRGKTVLNMDHHISNNRYGTLNYIDSKSSSACEVAYDFFKSIDYEIGRNVATCLLSGILGDTSGFIHSTTSAKTVKIASELIKTGVKIHQIFDFVVRNKTIGGLRLWGEVLSRLRINDDYGIAYSWIKDSDFNDFGVREEELDGIANFMNAIVEVNATALFRIGSDHLKASWRTKRDDIDLSKFCGYFGGGGHQKASGFYAEIKVLEKDGGLAVAD